MSLSQQKINEAYAELCKQLGDLVLKRDALQQEIDKLKGLVAGLNAAAPIAQQAEKEVIEMLNREVRS